MTWTVADYRAESLLGRGGFGEVWSGIHVLSGDTVALKRIPVSSLADRARATAEAAVLAALDHPHLVRLYEFLPGEDSVVLAMELAGGGSLAALLRRRDRLTPAEVGASLSAIASALAYAHDNGVSHGDVSASNVLFTRAGRAKLADLGLARVLGSGRSDGMLGTPAYLDPVIAAGGPASTASDVFGLAAVALHALTGVGPWHAAGADVSAVLAHAARGHIPHLAQLDENCPTAMAHAIRRALDPDPVRRGSAADLALDLRCAIDPKPVALAAGRIGGARHRAPETMRGRSFLAQGDDAFLSRVPTDLTNIARPQVRAAIASTSTTAPPRRAPVSWWHRRHAMAALVASGLAGAAAAGLMLLPSASDAQEVRQRTAPGPATAPAGGSAAVDTPTLHATTTAQHPHVLADAQSVLAALDRRRGAAYARRDDVTLAALYASSDLAARDVAQMHATVPEGCVLVGLSTTYSNTRTVAGNVRNGSRIVLSTLATVRPSRLHCPGEPERTVTGAAPSRLTIVLTRRGADTFAIRSITAG